MSTVNCPHPIGKSVDGHSLLFSITVPVGFYFEDSITAHLWRVRGDFLWINKELPSLPGLGVSCLM